MSTNSPFWEPAAIRISDCASLLEKPAAGKAWLPWGSWKGSLQGLLAPRFARPKVCSPQGLLAPRFFALPYFGPPFRPIVRHDAGRDVSLQLIRRRYDLPFPEESMVGLNRDDARERLAGDRLQALL